MANIFDTANAPLTEPSTIVAGDLVQWWQKDLVIDYPIADYSLKYTARTADSGGYEFSVTATESSEGYLIQITSTASAAFFPGTYSWQQEIIRTSDSARAVLKKGQFVVIESMDKAHDPRSHAEIMLQKIESVLQNKADADVASYSVAGRSLTKMSFAELMAARDMYKAEVRKQLALSGQGGSSSTIKVRFT
jgi:hypothetical protein